MSDTALDRLKWIGGYIRRGNRTHYEQAEVIEQAVVEFERLAAENKRLKQAVEHWVVDVAGHESVTCVHCSVKGCDMSFDPYNTNGDCLMEK